MFETFLLRSGLKKDLNWSRFVAQWLILSLILHLIAAVSSSGFYHADEHFQIVEFMNYKLGRTPMNELPLEFGQFLRPWLLPAIFTGMTTFLDAIGITSPFDWALSYRVFSSLLGWLSTVGLSLCCYFWFPNKKWRNWAVILTSIIWYLPSLHARHSSENLGGSVFFIGLTLLLLCSPAKPKHADRPAEVSPLLGLGVGLLFGFAFEFRYQVGAFVAGAFLWLLFFARIPFRNYLSLLAGLGIGVGLGTLADYWGYGQWTFAPWNYVKFNLIDNHVSDMDVSPWWDYFRRATTEAWPVLGILTLMSFPIAWLRFPKHVLTWSMVPFFLVHEIIGHKELRFLFPLAHAGAILIILSICWIPWPNRRWLTWPLYGLAAINVIALLSLSLVPAWMPVRFYSALYDFHPYGFRLYFKDDSFFNMGGAKLHFYRPTDLPMQRIESYSDLVPTIQDQNRPAWLFYSRKSLPDDAGILKEWCQPEFSTLPNWLSNLKLGGLTSRMTNWTLFQCQNPNSKKSQFGL